MKRKPLEVLHDVAVAALLKVLDFSIVVTNRFSGKGDHGA